MKLEDIFIILTIGVFAIYFPGLLGLLFFGFFVAMTVVGIVSETIEWFRRRLRKW